MKVIIDTNVLLSAALRDRVPEQVVLFIATNDEWTWLVTPDIWQEYVEVLKRPKFGFAADTIRQWVELLDSRTVEIGNPPVLSEFARDPKDAPFLAAAIFGGAAFLITGDRDLLDARATLSIRVVTPAEFAEEFCID